MKRPRVCCPLGLCLLPTLQALADAFRVNKTIKAVDLSYNQIGDEGVKARPPQRAAPATRGARFPAHPETSVHDGMGLGFLQHLIVCVHFLWVCRADPSTHSAARPWPRPWKSTKPSQWSRSTIMITKSSQCSVMKDARRSGLEGKFFQSRWVERDICLCQLRMRKQKTTTCAEARGPVVLVSSHPETHRNQPTFFFLIATGEFACRPLQAIILEFTVKTTQKHLIT